MLRPGRRGLLRLGAAGLAASAGLAPPLRAQPSTAVRPAQGLGPAQPFPRANVPDSATLLMPGPEGGNAARWAEGVAAGLLRGLPHALALRPAVLGGPDGVTAANRFATTEAGDGRTLLVLPGIAAHLRLVGESRAQFAPEGWLPLCVSWQGAILAGRGAWPGLAVARAGRDAGLPLRLALPGPEAPEASALLALDLMGIPTVPIFGNPGQAMEELVGRGQADAAVICSAAPLRLAELLGMTPWLELETPGRRELPQLPSTAAVMGPAARLEAMQAGFAAMRLRAALMLPELTSADIVAAWRRAALRWQEDESRQPVDSTPPALVGAEARSTIAPLFPSAPAMLAYREWLLRRLSWQAG